MSENKCPTCGKETGELGHLCTPQEVGDSKCDWCGSIIPNARHMCSEKVKKLSYICNSCGRTAVNPDELCKPEEIE